MNLKFDFAGRHALVTGGAQGIGFHITRLFLQAGGIVTVWDYSSEALAQAEKELSQYKDRLHLQQVDVGDRPSCQTAATALTSDIHILINNAGITRDKSFSKMSDEEFDAVIRTNLTGLYNVTKAAMPRFNESSTDKRIINMASVVALYGNFGQTNYVAAKAGVIGLTKTWAREFSRKGFTVNAVAPGFTLTKMVKAMPQEVTDSIAAKIPVGRLGDPDDIANACLFLATQEAGYINGATISVDGGLVC